MSNQAWVTLATNDSYGLGALVLAHSLRRVASSYPAVVLITPSVTEPMRERLRAVFAEVIIVDVLDSGDAAHLALLQRPELGITFTKIHCWNLTQYQKCVFLDADTLIVQNCDELFEREQLSAAPDVGWPDCFNSGVFVFTPSADTFKQLIAFAQERGSFDGGDQGLLNSFFSDWSRGDINKRLPFLYNVTSAAFYSYLPALKQFGQDLKIIHFIGAAKPWLQQYNFESGAIDAPEHIRGFLQLWWDIFVTQVHCQLDTGMVEVEEVPPEVPAIPLLDVSLEYHYQPILDPQSEFAWHHPDSQKKEEPQEKQIDITEFFDPWNIYRGHIPYNETSHNSELGRVENQEEIRNYVWDYQTQKHSQHHVNQTRHIDQIWQQQPTTHSNHHWQPDLRQIQTLHWQQQEHLHQNENPTRNSDSHWQNDTQQYNNQTQNDDHIWQHYSQQHSDQTQHINQSEQTYHTNNIWQHNSQQHDNFHTYNNWQYESQPNHNNTDNFWQQQHYSTTLPYDQNRENSLQLDNHTSHSHFREHETHQHNQHMSYHHEHKHERDNEGHSQHPHNHTHHDSSSYIYHNKPSYLDDSNQESKQIEHNHKDHTISENISVHFVQVENVKKRNRRKRRPHPIDVYGRNDVTMNGDVSESESDEDEEIIPRHPYDGFYLRHRATIDSRGRKICSHEIPPISTPPPDSPLPNSDVDEEEEYFTADSCEEQSGVAGNLARVLPGNPGQREALDELTRRQGWEAGNIDYMGADSFDNIWAKISQTLSKPRPSPPKQQSPPKEIVPTQLTPEQIEVQSGKISTELASEQVEVAKEAVPEESTATESEKASEVEKTVDEPVTLGELSPVQICPVAPETVTPVQTVVPSESDLPIETPATEEAQPSVEATETKCSAIVEAIVEFPTKETPINTKPPASIEIEAKVKAAPTGTEVNIDAGTETVAPAKATSIENPVTIEATVPAEVVTPIEDAATETEVSVGATAHIKPVAPVKGASIESPTIIKTHVPADVVTLKEAGPIATTATTDVSIEALVETTPIQIPTTVEASTTPKIHPAVNIPLTVEATDIEMPASVNTVATESPKVAEAAAVKDQLSADPVKVVEKPEQKTENSVDKETSSAPVSEPMVKVSTESSESAPVSPGVVIEASATNTTPTSSTPEKSTLDSTKAVDDSPPLLNTPPKKQVPNVVAIKSEERRKPAGKLKLVPPAAADPLPTPDSELEDAAALAQSIIASELRTPTVTSPEPAAASTSPTPPSLAPALTESLPIAEPEVPTPPVGAVSLAQIGVKSPPKGKSTTAAQIASSVVETPPDSAPEPVTSSPVSETAAPALAEVPKKKIVKKLVKKEAGASGADAPVPPPRKKEKKPKEK